MKKQYLIIAFLLSCAASIVHSMPGYVLAQEERQGKIKLGECCETMDAPQWHCKECEYERIKVQIQPERY